MKFVEREFFLLYFHYIDTKRGLLTSVAFRKKIIQISKREFCCTKYWWSHEKSFPRNDSLLGQEYTRDIRVTFAPRNMLHKLDPSWIQLSYDTWFVRIEKVSGVDKFIKRRLVAVITFSCKYCRNRNLLKKKKKGRKVDKCFFFNCSV